MIPKRHKFSGRQTQFKLAVLKNYEFAETRRAFKLEGYDHRLTFETLIDAEEFVITPHLDINGSSIDYSLFKPAVMQFPEKELHTVDGVEYVDFSKLTDTVFLLGLTENYSERTDTVYTNLSVCIPLIGSLLEDLSNYLSN